MSYHTSLSDFTHLTECPKVLLGITAGISNLGGQMLSIVRSANDRQLSLTSLGFSFWGGGYSGFITKEINVPLTKAIIESIIQEPINGIGFRLGEK